MDKKTLLKQAFRKAFPYTTPVLAGFMVLGIAYGILMQVKGYGTIWSVLMSMICFAGSAQFVAITFLTSAFDPVAAFLLSILVNARHLFYGISMLKLFRGLGPIKTFLIFGLCDETFSVASCVDVPEGIERDYFYFAITFLHYSYWVTGTFVGSIIGHFVNFNTTGLDYALTALFIVLFLEQVRKKGNLIPGIIGLVATAVMLFIFGADSFVIPAMVLLMVFLLLTGKSLKSRLP